MDGYQNYLVNDKDELKRLYENKVIEYENVDDVYASKVDFWYYSKYTSFGEGFLDKLEWIGGALKSFGEGICGGVVDVVKGIGTLLWEIGEFAISGITCLVFTGVGCEPPEWASKNINETVDTVKLIMDDPIVILEGIGQGVSDAYEKEGICYCAGYAIGSYVGTKGITKATKVVTGKIKGIRANKELPKVEIENTLDELDEFEKFYDDIYDAQRELNPEYEEFLDDLTKAPDDGIVIESGINSLADMMSPEEAARYKAYFVKDAPDMVFSGTKELEGIHVHYNKLKGVEEVQPWKAYYDDYGRLVARTDYNAGNKAAGIPDVHYHLYEWGKGFADWKSPHEYASHLEGEFTWTTKR